MRGDVGVGEGGPTPDTLHADATRRHPMEVTDLKETFHGGGVEFLESPPPPQHHLPRRHPALPAPGERRVHHLLLQQPGVEQKLITFPHHLVIPSPLCLHNLPPPRHTILRIHHPPRNDVAAPINKVGGGGGGCEGPTLLGSAGESHVTPRGGSGRGSVRMGDWLEIKGGGAHHDPRNHGRVVVV